MTMTDVYRNTVDAPPIAPPRYSLLTALPTVDEPGGRWEAGYTYVSELSGAHGGDPMDQCLAFFTGSNNVVHDWVNVDPVVLWAEAYCRSTLGGLPRDFEAVARRKLAAHQSYDLARALGQNYLADAASGSATDTGLAVADGVGYLEDQMSNRLQGPPGTMWCSLGTLDQLAGSGAVRLDGARWITAAGTPVAADAGLHDTKPTGAGTGEATGWLFGTGPARVRLGPIEVPNADQLRQLVDRATNTVRLQAWRVAAVEVDYGDTADAWPGTPEGAPFAVAVQVTSAGGTAAPVGSSNRDNRGGA